MQIVHDEQATFIISQFACKHIQQEKVGFLSKTLKTMGLLQPFRLRTCLWHVTAAQTQARQHGSRTPHMNRALWRHMASVLA